MSPRRVVGVSPDEAVFAGPPPAAAYPTPALAAELEELTKQKVAAAEREDYEEAKRLKELIDSMQQRARAGQGQGLEDQLRRAMCHVDEAEGLAEIAEALHAQAPHAVYTIIAEYQPTLSAAKIARNWRKIIGIYLDHARAAAGAAPNAGGAEAEEAYDAMAQIKGVINFLDAPLSPKTLRNVRDIRRGVSPKRDRPVQHEGEQQPPAE